MTTIYAESGQKIRIGKQGERGVTEILFPAIDGTTVILLHRRHGDEHPYESGTVTEVTVGGTAYVCWTVSAVDTAVAGIGECEVSYYVGDTVAKTVTYYTIVDASVEDGETTVPSAAETWVQTVADKSAAAGASAVEAAESAAEAKQDYAAERSARETADTALADKIAAEETARKAADDLKADASALAAETSARETAGSTLSGQISKLNEDLDTIRTANRNLWIYGDLTIVGLKTYQIAGLAAGTYTFSAVVTPNDTDSDQCLVIVKNGVVSGSIILAQKLFDRGTRQSLTFSLADGQDCYMWLYPSTTYNLSSRDTANWTSVQVEAGEAATPYVDPGYTANDTTARAGISKLDTAHAAQAESIERLNEDLSGKQDTLTAGSGISISGSTVSAKIGWTKTHDITLTANQQETIIRFDSPVETAVIVVVAAANTQSTSILNQFYTGGYGLQMYNCNLSTYAKQYRLRYSKADLTIESDLATDVGNVESYPYFYSDVRYLDYIANSDGLDYVRIFAYNGDKYLAAGTRIVAYAR